MYGRGRRCSSAKRSEPAPRSEQIARIERRIAEYQAKMAECAPQFIPDYQRMITNEVAVLKAMREQTAAEVAA